MIIAMSDANIQRSAEKLIHYIRMSASEKRRNALKSFVSKFRRNSLLLQKISLIQHTRGFSNVIVENTAKSCSRLYFLIIDLFIVLAFLCVIEFSQKSELKVEEIRVCNKSGGR